MFAPCFFKFRMFNWQLTKTAVFNASKSPLLIHSKGSFEHPFGMDGALINVVKWSLICELNGTIARSLLAIDAISAACECST